VLGKGARDGDAGLMKILLGGFHRRTSLYRHFGLLVSVLNLETQGHDQVYMVCYRR
jgi:hypothetical protein